MVTDKTARSAFIEKQNLGLVAFPVPDGSGERH